MTVLQIGLMTLFALILGRLKKGRNPLLLVMSVMTLFWLQPSQPENSWRFWFPFMTLFLVMLAWLLTSTKNQRSIKNNFLTIIVMTVIPLSLTLTRYLKFENIYLTEIPRIQVVLTVTLVGFALVVLEVPTLPLDF